MSRVVRRCCAASWASSVVGYDENPRQRSPPPRLIPPPRHSLCRNAAQSLASLASTASDLTPALVPMHYALVETSALQLMARSLVEGGVVDSGVAQGGVVELGASAVIADSGDRGRERRGNSAAETPRSAAYLSLENRTPPHPIGRWSMHRMAS